MSYKLKMSTTGRTNESLRKPKGLNRSRNLETEVNPMAKAKRTTDQATGYIELHSNPPKEWG